jgi:hypothetical protein
MVDLGLTQQDVLQFVFDMMGVPTIMLRTPVKTIQTHMNTVLEKFSRKKPRIKFSTLGASAGKQGYPIDPNASGYGVIDVMLPRLDPIAPLLLSSGPRLDIFGYRYSYPYRDIAELEIDYIYFEMATRVLSSDIDWQVIDDNLFLYPCPTDTFQLSYAYAAPKILGDKNTNTPCTIPRGDWDLIKDGVLALTKITEGSILNRIPQVPGTNFTQPFNGDQLLKDGQNEWQKWEDTLNSRTPLTPPTKGSNGGRLVVGY